MSSGRKTNCVKLNSTEHFFSIAWTTITFFGESVKGVFDKETNETYYVEIPRLPVKSFYPWNAMSGIPYMGSFAFQVYYLLFSMLACNLSDVLFCSWLIFACEQLQHLKVVLRRPVIFNNGINDAYIFLVI